MGFRERLEAAWSNSGTALCAGVEPRLDTTPVCFGAGLQGLRQWGRAFIDSAGPHVAAFKFQIAHFAAASAEAVLEDLIRYARDRQPDRILVLDAKRSDIGSTAEFYAREAFERFDADAVTVNPYLGSDGILPFTAWTDRGTIVLCHTSNPGAAEFQGTPPEGGVPLFERVARAARRWNSAGNVMLVVGATHLHALRRVRLLAPDVPLLVPGVGAQGGDPAAVMAAGADAAGRGLLVNVSRALQPRSEGPPSRLGETEWRAAITENAVRYAAVLRLTSSGRSPAGGA
jgi:orotidine-5'-phosphate decarboxylase